MSDNNTVFVRRLADFLEIAFPPATSAADKGLRTSLAVFVISRQALTSQGVGNPIIGPHKIEDILIILRLIGWT